MYYKKTVVLFKILSVTESVLVFSTKSRLVAGGLLLCIAYLPLINSFFFDGTVTKDKSYAKVDSFDNGSSGCCMFASDIDLSDVQYNNSYLLSDVFLNKADELHVQSINSLIDSLATVGMESTEPVQEKTALTKKTKDQKKTSVKLANVSPVKIVNVGEHVDARVVKSKIKSSFYSDARSLGIPAAVINSTIKILSEKVDFRRSIKKNDHFEILYSKKNEMLYAKITTKKGDFSVYRFANGKSSSYYFANGDKTRSVAQNKSFGLPLNGKLSVSDKFGWRRHPFTGQYQNHTGVDLRAPYGSPVLAVYDGVVTRASYYCGYGHCIDIKHASGYSSRYAHLSKYSVRVGGKVRKGQVIGSVGSSGVSTGPHLHLELARNNAVLNPFSVKMMPTEKPSVGDKFKFEIFKKKISKTFKSM